VSHDSYATLIVELAAVGLTGQLSHPDQLVVSSQRGPVWPNRGNSFWLSLQGNDWHLITWSPTGYRIPARQNVVDVCLACMECGTSAMYQVPDEIVGRFGLSRIPDSDFERLFPESDDERP
jgi:hypothetical protein